MGTRTDAVLASISLAGFVIAFAHVGSRLSISCFVLGCVGTIGFELVAFQYYGTVRAYWERRPVQLAALALSFGIVGLGVAFAPTAVLSAGIGTLVTYLLFLFAVVISRAR
ncbi:hypothetical protein ACERIM_05930 [Natrinema sp. H-ect1]|uniref:hypothetical protein n=1 Tax=Natrinema sp. H-ect1 TaxID=3242700 RepID=UPI00359CBB57